MFINPGSDLSFSTTVVSGCVSTLPHAPGGSTDKETAFYWASTAAGSTGLLVALPFIVEATTANWRTSYWFWSGFSAFSLILGIFYLPKTLYPRPPAFIDGQVIITDQYGNVTIIAAEGAPHLASEVQQDSSEKEPTPPKTYLEELVPFKYEKQGFRRCYMTYAEMAISLLNPSIFFLLILNSLLFAGLVCQSLTYSIQLELPPWHFSPAAVGTAQAGPFFGALIAHALCGATVDRISAILTRRNNEPEHILPNFIVPTLLAFLGLVVYGVVAGNLAKYHWIGVHISLGIYFLWVYCNFGHDGYVDRRG